MIEDLILFTVAYNHFSETDFSTNVIDIDLLSGVVLKNLS